MNYIVIAFAIFILLEMSNVITMYYFNQTTIANGVGVFKSFVEQKDEGAKDLMTYLIYWVAGTKIIFMSLLVVIIFFGSETLQQVTSIVLASSIGVFYLKMYPLVQKIERDGGISTKNYSRNLAIIIGVFMAGFILSLVLTLI